MSEVLRYVGKFTAALWVKKVGPAGSCMFFSNRQLQIFDRGHCGCSEFEIFQILVFFLLDIDTFFCDKDHFLTIFGLFKIDW